MMKNLIITLLACSPITLVVASIESVILARAENKVIALYRDLETISNPKTNASQVSKIKFQFEDYFIVNDMDCPNEFKLMGYNPQDYIQDIRVQQYFNMFCDMFRDEEYKDCTFETDIIQRRAERGAEFKKGESQTRQVTLIVKKKYLRSGRVWKEFCDTLLVGTENMKVKKWANGASKNHFGYFGEDLDNVEKMRDAAVHAYENKNYTEAYRIYQEIISKFPKNGDAYYRVAIMLYKEQGCPDLKRKIRLNKVYGYLNKAIQNGDYTTRKHADNMQYWITNGRKTY